MFLVCLNPSTHRNANSGKAILPITQAPMNAGVTEVFPTENSSVLIHGYSATPILVA